MVILNVNRLSKNFGYGQLFEDVSFSLCDGETLSIVGPNGSGKSTLLKMIAGIEKIENGSVSVKKGAKVAYLDQTGSSVKDNRTVCEILHGVFKELNEMNDRISFLQAKLNENVSQQEYNDLTEKYCNLIERFSTLGGYDIDLNISTVTEGLKIDKKILNQSYDNLSGGEKTLVQLAKALLIKPDLFLLDEPTNHLDIKRIEWLEGYLKSFKGATVIVSHDRYFLDKMSNKILSLEYGQAIVYSTNYTGYLQEKQNNYDKLLALYQDQQEKIKQLEQQIKYFSEMGMAKNSSTMCDRAHALQTQLDRFKKSAVQKPTQTKKINVNFKEERKTSKCIIDVKNFSVKTPENSTILDNINLQISSGERVAFIGENGSGKSTLIKSIMRTGQLLFSGEVCVGPNVKIGYLPQIIEFPCGEKSLLNYFEEEASVSEEKARQILSAFNFNKEDINKRLKNLSGGEKVRVKLAILLQQKINTLIFDEPTNHIDILTKEVLEESIENFDGTLIFVSHDRFFINKFADKIIEFANGKICSYIGDYDYYKSHKQLL